MAKYRPRIGPWLAKKAMLYRLHINQRDIVVVDLGAHKGNITDFYLRMWPYAQYFLVEPFPGNVAILRKKYEGMDNMHIIPKAISNEVGNAILQVGGNTSEMSSIVSRPPSRRYYRHLLDKGDVEVETTTIDALMEEFNISKIHVIKSDTQGSEYNMLLGAKKALRYKKIFILYMEIFFAPVYDCPLFWEICQVLDKYGYAFFDMYAEARAKVSRQMTFADAIWISPRVRSDVLDTLPPEWLIKNHAEALGMGFAKTK